MNYEFRRDGACLVLVDRNLPGQLGEGTSNLSSDFLPEQAWRAWADWAGWAHRAGRRTRPLLYPAP